MRPAWWVVIVCAAATGCLDKTPAPSSVRARPFMPPAVAEGLFVESVLVERPIGDAVLDQAVWVTSAPVLPPEPTALLAENGVRVAVVGGNLPPAFQSLMATEADLVNPHGLTFGGRKDAVIPTAGPIDPCTFEALTDLAGTRQPFSLRQARSGWQVRPDAIPDGRVKLACEPQVQHGDRQEWLRPTADGTRFVVHGEVPTERFPELGFEVTLGPNDYLLVGWSAASGDTLGGVLFAAVADGRPRQRLLVVRARQLGATPTDLPAISNPRGRPGERR